MKEKKQVDFEKVTFTCPNCNREIKMLKPRGYDTKWLLCQKCGTTQDRFPDTD